MKNLIPGLHPSFEALSAYSDLNDVDRVSARLTRHVSRCAECQGVLNDLREFGVLARTEPSAVPDQALWGRIESAARQPRRSEMQATAELTSPIWSPAPALRPTSNWPIPAARSGRKAWGIGLAAAAAILIALIAWPSRQPLEATGTIRLTFSPVRPVPGGLVKVRYAPAPWLKGQPRLVLVARRVGDSVFSYFAPSGGDSIATIRPVSGGAYEGEFRLAPGSRALWMAVSDSLGNETDGDGWRPWLLIAGGADGKPSLPALLAATEVPMYFGAEQFRTRQSVDPADSLRRYFPEMPAGWAYARPGQGKGTLFERLLSFFDSSERKYMAFYNDLWPRKNLDAERMHEMVAFGMVIDEPAEANRWARRLALEHPEDPRALRDLVEALHQLELTEPPGLRDSVRQWLPVFDRLYQHSGVRMEPFGFMQLIARYADASTVERWNARIDSTVQDNYLLHDYETNPAHRKRAEVVWLRNAQRSCERPRGKFPFRAYNGDWMSDCQYGRASAYRYLAHAKYVDGDARAALAYTDSAQSASLAAAPCGRFWTSAKVEIATSLALGDTARAERAAAARLGTWPDDKLRDSVALWLGQRAQTARFKAAVDSVHAAFTTCSARENAQHAARMQRYRSAN